MKEHAMSSQVEPSVVDEILLVVGFVGRVLVLERLSRKLLHG